MKFPELAVIGCLLGVPWTMFACGGPKMPPPEDVASCLAELNGELAGAVTCDAIVKAISTVVSRNQKCSELLLHGLRCTNGKDGG